MLDELAKTLSDEEFSRTIAIRWPTLALRETAIEKNPRSTIEPAPAHGPEDVVAMLARAQNGSATDGLELESTLGEGGMGIVRLATQRSLGRKVAVKTLKPGLKGDPVSTARLVREAWVTGQLEHPNVVPIYDLGLDDRGVPVIVLRRIEGAPWEALFRQADEVRTRFRAEDLLEWNLRILIQLTYAVGLAHDRGIVHRDIKPENVMIGGFGEVYLVDWGIAVSLRADPAGKLPLASDTQEPAGTPCYMAPEMLGIDFGKLSERTDVYLLGATLYEVLTGHPPHKGDNLASLIRSVMESKPTFPSEVPAELGAICKQCMSARPEDRFASVAMFRGALEDFLRHRGAILLIDEADARREELDEALGRISQTETAGDLRGTLYNLFGACRFGYRQALREWPESARASAGLHAACERMVEFELLHGSAEAAAAILAEFAEAPPALTARVKEALDAGASERRKLETLRAYERDHDPATGGRTRAGLGVGLGLMWTFFPQLLAFYETHGRLTYRSMVMGGVFLVVVQIGLSHWARQSLNATALNRNLVHTVRIGMVAQLFFVFMAWSRGLAPRDVLFLLMQFWCVLAWVVALIIERKLLVSGVAYLVAVGVATRWPEQQWNAWTAVHGFLVLNMFLAWGSYVSLPPRKTPG